MAYQIVCDRCGMVVPGEAKPDGWFDLRFPSSPPTMICKKCVKDLKWWLATKPAEVLRV